MNAPVHARCFGGGILEGGSPVRLTYLDEAGISNPRQEPYLVIAGIILHGDQHWRPLEEELRAIGRRYLPDEAKPLFHAKDIFHGSGAFDRNNKKWPRHRRWHLLAELCELPRKFDVPVVVAFTERARFRTQILEQFPKLSAANIQIITHADTFVRAAMAVEGWMSLSANKNESALMVAEDAPNMRKILKAVHSGYTDRFRLIGDGLKLFHSNHIVDTVHFAGKRESMPLQVADACAFIIKRRLMQIADSVTFFDVLRPQIAWHDDEQQGLLVEQS
jgi:hypothetical protein